MTELSLACRCGAVRGVIRDISPKTGNRVICYCDDCQAYAHHLQADGEILDKQGGTEIYQLAQVQVAICEGSEHLRCLRLKPKGLLRWYTDCCNTPVANSMSAGVPIIGIVHSFMDDRADRDQVLGPVKYAVQAQYARNKPDTVKTYKNFPLGLITKALFRILKFRLQGKHKPSPFYGIDGRPIVKPEIVNQ